MYTECIRNFKNIIIIRNNVYRMYKEFKNIIFIGNNVYGMYKEFLKYNNQYTIYG